LKKNPKKEANPNEVDHGKEGLQNFGETLTAATVDYTKIVLLNHLYIQIINFAAVSECKDSFS
jgi:hypothetical protein